MVAVFERKDGTSIVCGPRPRRRHTRKKFLVLQFVLGVTCVTLGIWLLLA